MSSQIIFFCPQNRSCNCDIKVYIISQANYPICKLLSDEIFVESSMCEELFTPCKEQQPAIR